MMNPIELKSINELLLSHNFYIPSYQRGYRWSKQQVEDLLNDIWEFIQNNPKKEEFYCLQPIVVKSKESKQWNVIDGQQRLTTIYLILKSLEDKIDSDTKNYTLEYETRKNSEKYLTNLAETDKEENVDYYHMYSAYEVINDWFKQKANNGHSSIKSKFISPLLEQTKVIWYEIEENEQNEIDVFTRINMGKIPLTNAELIKALLLKTSTLDDDIKYKEQLEIATEWDSIEYVLQNDEFWYFLKSKDDKSTRIELIFELLTEDQEFTKNFKIEMNKSIDNYYTFHIFNEFLSGNNDTKKAKEYLWKEVKKIFRMLNEWFENRELFHKVGFLLSQTSETLTKILAESKSKNKDEFIQYINQKIKNIFKDVIIDELEYGDKNILKVLLYFNIQTLINNKKSNIRFQFDRFKRDDWDIEHIRSQTDITDKKAWIENLEQSGFEIANDRKVKILNSDEEFKKYILEQEGDGFEKNPISNLALLDSKTNRGYKNAFFSIKRKKILQNDMNGTFIPICTRNVFMKYYTANPTNLTKWAGHDADAYLEAIKETLQDYLPQENVYGN